VGGTMGSPRSEPQVGIEPTPVRLQGGRSAELSFKGVSPPRRSRTSTVRRLEPVPLPGWAMRGGPRRGIRTPNLLFVREALSAFELPAGGVICDERDAPARFERAHVGSKPTALVH
jgi:hypothetical protein